MRHRFLTDYFHTAIILIIACYFSVKAFSTDQVGSIENLYDLVQEAAQRHPVSGNHEGTYLTMTSKSVSIYSFPFFLSFHITYYRQFYLEYSIHAPISVS